MVWSVGSDYFMAGYSSKVHPDGKAWYYFHRSPHLPPHNTQYTHTHTRTRTHALSSPPTPPLYLSCTRTHATDSSWIPFGLFLHELWTLDAGLWNAFCTGSGSFAGWFTGDSIIITYKIRSIIIKNLHILFARWCLSALTNKYGPYDLQGIANLHQIKLQIYTTSEPD